MSEETKWTPGPWKLSSGPKTGQLCIVTDDAWICGQLSNGNRELPGEGLANAHLIIEASNLYAGGEMAHAYILGMRAGMVESAVRLYGREPDRWSSQHKNSIAEFDAILNVLGPALARARGEQP